MEISANLSYRSASPRALWASILSVVAILSGGVAALYSMGQIQLLEAALSGSPIPTAVAEVRDARQWWIELTDCLVALGAGVAFFMWVYRANQNARDLSGNELEFSPGWSVGWFFVPIAALFMPYRVVAEIWRRQQSRCPARLAEIIGNAPDWNMVGRLCARLSHSLR